MLGIKELETIINIFFLITSLVLAFYFLWLLKLEKEVKEAQKILDIFRPKTPSWEKEELIIPCPSNLDNRPDGNTEELQDKEDKEGEKKNE